MAYACVSARGQQQRGAPNHRVFFLSCCHCGVQVAPVPSLLRGFSAPVHLTVEGQSDEDLLHILAHDTGGCLPARGPCVLRVGISWLLAAHPGARHWWAPACAWAVRSADVWLLCVESVWLHADASSFSFSTPGQPFQPTFPPNLFPDSFNRWEAGHVLAKKLLRALYTAAKDSSEVRQHPC